jgi:Raf kinase inhibitor-like YbhB/YbcL family protein
MIGRLLRPLRSGTARLAGNDPRIAAPSTIEVSSPDFASGTMMPARYRGKDAVLPPLRWTGVPADARQLVLVAEDVDVPFAAPLVHAIAYGLSPQKAAFAAGEIPKAGPRTPPDLPDAWLGKAMGTFAGYLAPTPIPGHGPHRYVYQIFALDTELARFASPPSKRALLAAMAGHVLARGAVVGVAEA